MKMFNSLSALIDITAVIVIVLLLDFIAVNLVLAKGASIDQNSKTPLLRQGSKLSLETHLHLRLKLCSQSQAFLLLLR